MEKKTTNNAVIAVIAVLLIAAIGFGVWKIAFASSDRQDAKNTDTSETSETKETSGTSTDNQSKPDEESNEGTISGSLTYPSESIPSELEVHAYNIDTKSDYFVKDRITGSEFTYGVGYRITVPAGKYYVYAVVPGNAEQKAYYNAFVTCGMSTECADTTKLEVVVKPGEDTKDIMVGDWYNS